MANPFYDESYWDPEGPIVLPPFEVPRGPRDDFNQNPFSTGFNQTFYTGADGGGGVGGAGGSASSTAAATNAVMGPLPPASPTFQIIYGDPLLDKIAAERIAAINEGRARQGLPPLTQETANKLIINSDGTTTSLAEGITLDVEKGLQAEFGLQDAAKTQAARSAATAAKASGNSGVPLILPIPGIDPMTGLAITAAGLIFSGGKVARLDPSNPIGSVVNAAKGTVGTIGNAADVITGEQKLSDIWGLNTTGGSGSGAGAGSAGGSSGAGSSGGSGGQTEIDPNAGNSTNVIPVIGGLGSGSTGNTSGGAVSVTPGALGGVPGQTTPAGGAPAVVGAGSTKTGTTASTTNAGDNKALDQMNIWLGGVGKTTPTNTGTTVSSGATGTGTGGNTNTGGSASTAVTSVNPWDAIEKMKRDAAKAAQDKIDADIAALGVVATNKTKTDDPKTKVSVGVTGIDDPDPATSTTVTGKTKTGATSTVVTTVPTFNFISPTNSGLAQRDFAKEFGLTAATLTGKPGDDLAAYYKKLQQQFTPSSLTTLGTTAETQLAADLARYNQAQSGNLSAEDTRSAQQSAREAYGARGQVMGRGAIGAEILNRDSLQRQRESEARASVQQSIGNLRNAADLQTGNIFSPFAKLISENYSPQSAYAREVYDYNVNAYNAYQAAQQNLAAYKEAASKGQEAQFINSFVGFLTNNGIQTTTSAVQNIINGLLRPSGGSSTTNPTG